jgi:hypothetical protein
MRNGGIRNVCAGLTGVLSLLVVAGLNPPAPQAASKGITGFSGNPATMNGNYCNVCHYGGPGPQVALSGPAQVTPGSSNTYIMRIVGGSETAGGFDVSASAGELASLDPSTQALNGEVTHVAPKLVDAGGNVVFRFRWTAPLTPGSYTLYGAANSVNLSGSPSGDRSTKVVRTITVK